MGQLESENIVALCDVDANYLTAAAQKHPGAKTYSDFRRLLDQEGIDAVLWPRRTIRTPSLRSGR